MTRPLTRIPALLLLCAALVLTACGSPAMTADRIRQIGEATAAAGPARFAVDLDLGPLAGLGLEAPEITGVIDPASGAIQVDIDMPEDLVDRLGPLAGLLGGEAPDPADLARLELLAQDTSLLLVDHDLYVRGGIVGDGWVGPFGHDDADRDAAREQLMDGPLAEVDLEALAADLRDALVEPLAAISEAATITATDVDGEAATSYAVTVDADDAAAIGEAIRGVLAELDPAVLPELDDEDGPALEDGQLPGMLGALDLSTATATLTAIVEDDTDRLRELRGQVELGSMELGATLRLFDFGGPAGLVAPSDATAPTPELFAELSPGGE